MIYDGDCEFCRRWIARWKKLTGDSIVYEAYQDVAKNYPEIPIERFESAVRLIDIDGNVYGGAEAVFRAFKRTPSRVWMWRVYDNTPGARFVGERVYQIIAKNR